MGMPFLCRALSESKLKAQLELSANDTCALKEDELKAKYEFSAAGVCRTLRECEPKTYRNFYQHLNTTKYTAFPVYNVLYDVIALCIQRDIA